MMKRLSCLLAVFCTLSFIAVAAKQNAPQIVRVGTTLFERTDAPESQCKAGCIFGTQKVAGGNASAVSYCDCPLVMQKQATPGKAATAEHPVPPARKKTPEPKPTSASKPVPKKVAA